MDDDLELSDLGFPNETTSSPLDNRTVRSATVNDEACYTPTNQTNQTEQHSNEVRAMYIWISSTLMLLCVLAILFNLVILISTRWVNGNKIKGVLLLSLSMSMADCYSLILLGLALLINSFLPVGLQIRLQNHEHAKTCVLLYLEGLRLGGLVTTICHILVLAGYHYLGARQPLCLKRRLTGRIIWLTCIIIWTVPPCVFCIIFYIMGNKKDCNKQFLMKRSFRNWFSIIILCCIGLIVVIYSLIYPIVRKHQYERSKRASIQGGQKIKRKKSESKQGCVTVTSCTPTSYAMRRSQRRAHCEKKREKTHKAIFTTILIVGSLVIGWLPALIYFAIVCDEKQCLFCRQTFVSQKTNLIINFLINTLLILKTAINSCIYAARMKEIKRALNLMCNQCLLFCCRDCLPPERLNSLLELHETRYSRGCSRRTVVNSLNEETAVINGTALFDSSNNLGSHSRRQLSCKMIKRPKGDDTSL